VSPVLKLRTLIPSLFVLLTLTQHSLCAPTEPVIVGYVFTREAPLAPGQIDPHKLTRINYAFANIENGRIVEGAPVAAGNLAILTALRHDNPGLTVLISVGGWAWSGGFSDMALTPVSRANFIDSVANFLTRHDLDGLDVDWEYPGQPGAGNKFRREDKRNYTMLLKELRARFDSVEKKSHRHLYLTIAAAATTDFLDHTEISEVQKYVDTVNLMAYDYYEPGVGGITGNHAPLFTDPADPNGFSADRSVRDFEQAGVPSQKIVLGVPFHGHAWIQVPAANHGLFQPGKAAPDPTPLYGEITGSMIGHGYTRYWDEVTSVPWLYDAQKQAFVSYEDSESLKLKCRYVLDHHLAGVMFWDYLSDPSGALLYAIDAALLPRTGSHATARSSKP
jgi:chitinase